jgi:SpoVK/Ycf46/Vps4 family AAA+-type ATPase
MSKGLKVESLLEVACAGIHNAYTESTDAFRAIVNSIEGLKELKPLLALLEEHGSVIIELASIAEVLEVLRRSILVDDEIAKEELDMGREVLEHSMHRLCFLNDYSEFNPLLDASEVHELLAKWGHDGSFFGGDFSDDEVIQRPLFQLAFAASSVTGDISIYDTVCQVILLISKLIISSDGVSHAEKMFLEELSRDNRETRDLVQKIIEHIATEIKKQPGDDEEPIGKELTLATTGSTPIPTGKEQLDKALSELASLVGVDEVKVEVQRLVNFLKVREQRIEAGLPVPMQSLHFVFTGNPGTGKTTVARILGRIFHGFGLLKSDNFVETDRSGLVGAFLGQTAIKTAEVIDKASDGVLFIDEAYSLSSNIASGDQYGQEAIDVLLKKMEDMRDRLVVIVAGYPDLMRQFLHSNPGLESRFTRFIHFSDYYVSDLCRIFSGMARNNSYKLTTEARGNLALLFNRAFQTKQQNFGNARFVRNAYEQTLGNHADRLSAHAGTVSREMLMTIEAVDLPFEMIKGCPGPFDLSNSRWRGSCPECQKEAAGSLKLLGQNVRCKCGSIFEYPWWNALAESLPAVCQYKDLTRPLDLTGSPPAAKS